MSLSLELFIHPMCPFAQRALYSMSFKGIQCKITEVDLVNKPQNFLEINPSGNLPTLLIKQNGQQQVLNDSFVVSQYFDTFQGKNMFPRLECGEKINLSEKEMIENLVTKQIDSLKKQIGIVYFNKNYSEGETKNFQSKIKAVDLLVPNGKFFLYVLLGRDEISYADLMALPLVERVLAFKDQGLRLYNGLDLNNLEMWFERMKNLDFTHKFLVPTHRFISLRHQMQSGTYHGLTLPATKYDNFPKL